MRKYLLSLFAGLILLFLGPTLAYAVDLTVTCNPPGPCSVTPTDSPLFNETGWVPGDLTIKQLTVVNQDPTEPCYLTLEGRNLRQTPETFADNLLTAIYDLSNFYFLPNYLSNLFPVGPISLGTVSPGTTKNFDWIMGLDSNVGNEFQIAQALFDFNLNFVCEGAAPTPTPNPPGGGGAPTCDSPVPNSAPVLTATQVGQNSVALSWTAVTPVTHYMIRYGITPGNYKYGAPNVGNVTHFTVNLLSAGTTYYFQVAGVNNCMPGPWSNEAGSRPVGVVLPVGPAPGFVEGTLGVSTEATPTATTSPTPTPDVLSASCTDTPYPWWIILVIQLVISFIYIWKRWKEKSWWMVLGFVAIVSQIIHEILGCNCATGVWCPRYWLLNLIIVFGSVLLYFYKQQNKKSSK